MRDVLPAEKPPVDANKITPVHTNNGPYRTMRRASVEEFCEAWFILEKQREAAQLLLPLLLEQTVGTTTMRLRQTPPQ